MQEVINLPKGFEVVPEDKIREVASTLNIHRTIRLFKGDTLEFGTVFALSKFTPNGAKEEKIIPHFGNAKLNGVCRPVPFAVTQRTPRDRDAFLAKYPLMREFAGCPSAYEVFEMCKGKKVVVTDLVEGEGVDWNATTDPKNPVYRKALFPVLEWKND